jgi:CheY-like chemotaxis protein
MEWKPQLMILVAEDDENDIFLLERAFKKVGVGMPSHICRDGAEAMAYLKGEGKFSDRTTYPFPRVLITDLKMPRCGGMDLLRWLHEHPECNLIPKIVLSASAELSDVKLAYQLGANCYFRKPTRFDDLVRLVELAQAFWTTAELPELPKNC